MFPGLRGCIFNKVRMLSGLNKRTQVNMRRARRISIRRRVEEQELHHEVVRLTS